MTQLKTFTTTAAVTGTANFSMDVRDIDWGAWQSVYVDMTLKGSGYMLLYPNGNKDAAYSSGYVTSNSYDSLAGMIGCGADGPRHHAGGVPDLLPGRQNAAGGLPL